MNIASRTVRNAALDALRPVLAMALLLATLSALGQDQGRYGPQEIALLPAYCRTNKFISSEPGNPYVAEQQHWERVLGSRPYSAIHHYCWAQMTVNRARMTARSKKERLSILNTSLGDFDYVLRYTSPEFVLLPEILFKRAEVMLELGRFPEANANLLRAIEVKPDYWPPYAALSDHYRNLGETQKAREWLDKGLAASPGSKTLQQRLAELGGSKGKPAPAGESRPARPKPPAESAPPSGDAREAPEKGGDAAKSQ
jgi:tetratricopeptide (TPR) repeat protein